ncbi:nucleotide-binding universal stress UspA family protein [Winogradskyella wandonensis]|uniref:Nucleotide-binding universal stress UspA family protein n=1 Tax=Winogradskyella wandonensis TaxID=1442586 RepID=A0A4R1KK51_9FLAO|nr:universal stress protein [Winogradskyella wandonensis]TCK64817.1 nucleotide-binding universal stress UspA family protein [Winogradskyella wandonensis]
MKNVLIPTDFSENSMNAIRYALQLFKYEKTEFYFLNAYEDEVYSNHELLEEEPFDEVIEMAKNRSKLKLDMLLKEVQKLAPHPRFKYHLVSAYNSIVDEVDKLVIGKNIDIIVMGTKGETYSKTYVFGSNTLQVLKYVSCPVLAIPHSYEYKQPHNVLFASNYLIPYSRREIKLLNTLLSPFRSVIDLLYISKSKYLSKRQRDNKSFLEEGLANLELNFKHIESKNVSKSIANYAKDHETDLLVMVNTRHSFLEDMLFRSKVDDFCLHTKIPFLALQNIRRNI